MCVFQVSFSHQRWVKLWYSNTWSNRSLCTLVPPLLFGQLICLTVGTRLNVWTCWGFKIWNPRWCIILSGFPYVFLMKSIGHLLAIFQVRRWQLLPEGWTSLWTHPCTTCQSWIVLSSQGIGRKFGQLIARCPSLWRKHAGWYLELECSATNLSGFDGFRFRFVGKTLQFFKSAGSP